jgi:hypothetical protein
MAWHRNKLIPGLLLRVTASFYILFCDSPHHYKSCFTGWCYITHIVLHLSNARSTNLVKPSIVWDINSQEERRERVILLAQCSRLLKNRSGNPKLIYANETSSLSWGNAFRWWENKIGRRRVEETDHTSHNVAFANNIKLQKLFS